MEKSPSLSDNMQRRLPVDLVGRFMVSDKQEFPCKIREVSLGEAVFATNIDVSQGDTIIAYVDQLGRIEGTVRDILSDGFRIEINATTHKREKLAAQLTWILNHDELDMEDKRHQKRMIPKNLDIEMKLDDGQSYRCKLIDLSVDGAAFSVAVSPPIGTRVTLGRMSAHVVRHFKSGIAVEFAKEIDYDE